MKKIQTLFVVLFLTTSFFAQDNPIISNLKSYKESVSKIKSTYADDTLSIVIEGFIKISLSDSQNAKKVTSLSLPKNTGM